MLFAFVINWLLFAFLQYVIPFCVISFVYIQMAVRLWGSKTPGNAEDTRDLALLRNKKRVSPVRLLFDARIILNITKHHSSYFEMHQQKCIFFLLGH